MATAEELLPIIRKVIKEEVSYRLDKLEGKIKEIALLRSSIDDCQQGLKEHEKSIMYNGNQITELLNETIPNFSKKFDDLAENMCTKILDIDIHRRKGSPDN